MDKTTVIIAVVIALLTIGNVYQYKNPKVVEVPNNTEQIDSTAWVQRSIYRDTRSLLDSLQTANQALSERIQEQKDRIANYTNITGKLKLQIDSLQQQIKWNTVPLTEMLLAPISIDTVFRESKIFGDDLFRVDGTVELKYRPNTYFKVRQDFNLHQLRDIRLDIVTTISDNHDRVLSYVTSPDFSELEYQSFTELKPKKRLPWFWIGLGAGVVGTIIIN